MNMKKLAFPVMLVLVFALSVSSAVAMIGGELDVDNDYPNVGAIVMYWPQFDMEGRLCSGTLIHPRALLTAAHCYPYFVNQGIGIDQIWVTFDQNAVADDATYLDVEAFIPHPDFGSAGADSHDIALVILEEAAEDYELVQLPETGDLAQLFPPRKGNRDDIELTVVGYGTSELLDQTYVLLDAKRRYGTVLFSALLPYQIRSEPGNAKTCRGDSGGPMFHENANGTEIQIGLAAGGGDPCTAGGFHYRLDTDSALDWINEQLAAIE